MGFPWRKVLGPIARWFSNVDSEQAAPTPKPAPEPAPEKK